jgi:hypothetical protein
MLTASLFKEFNNTLLPLAAWSVTRTRSTQGERCYCRFVLGQYGLLWALKHAEDISHLVILGTPLGLNTPLRPELAPYKHPVPFLRPKPDSKFAGDLFNAAGLAYVISYDDAQVRLARFGGRGGFDSGKGLRQWH